MLPSNDSKGWHYVAEGDWDLLGGWFGAGHGAPVHWLASYGGCGGQIWTDDLRVM